MDAPGHRQLVGDIPKSFCRSPRAGKFEQLLGDVHPKDRASDSGVRGIARGLPGATPESGVGAESLEHVDARVLPYLQLTDGLADPVGFVVPGQGVVPLGDIMAAMPTDVVVGLECPAPKDSTGPAEGVDPHRPGGCAVRAGAERRERTRVTTMFDEEKIRQVGDRPSDVVQVGRYLDRLVRGGDTWLVSEHGSVTI